MLKKLFTLKRSHLNFPIGLSWRGNPLAGGIGGICQKRAKFKNDGKVTKNVRLFQLIKFNHNISLAHTSPPKH